jgi:ribosomal protein S18 acetylase RimI-like enzyme
MPNSAVDSPSGAPTIRRAGADDFEVVRRHYAMVQNAHATHMPETFRLMVEADFPVAHFNSYLTDNNLLLIAERDGEAAGSLLATFREVQGHATLLPSRGVVIWYVVTEPALRRRGIARALIGAAAEWAAEKEADRIDLSVWSYNTDALALYRKLGFAESHIGMMIKPADALARWGSGQLPRPHLPRWLARR